MDPTDPDPQHCHIHMCIFVASEPHTFFSDPDPEVQSIVLTTQPYFGFSDGESVSSHFESSSFLFKLLNFYLLSYVYTAGSGIRKIQIRNYRKYLLEIQNHTKCHLEAVKN
jgi:hypothetical protein